MSYCKDFNTGTEIWEQNRALGNSVRAVSSRSVLRVILIYQRRLEILVAM